jgi:hypothetical protein
LALGVSEAATTLLPAQAVAATIIWINALFMVGLSLRVVLKWLELY